jgi:putative FmdB family regulatory protein
MPTYEFRCRNCGKEFSAAAHVKDLEQRAITCPNCGKNDLQELISPFIPKTSKKS